MQGQDLRTWMVLDPNWTRGYVAPREDAQPTKMPLRALERMLDSAAIGGDSAYVGVCFDIEEPRR